MVEQTEKFARHRREIKTPICLVEIINSFRVDDLSQVTKNWDIARSHGRRGAVNLESRSNQSRADDESSRRQQLDASGMNLNHETGESEAKAVPSLSRGPGLKVA